MTNTIILRPSGNSYFGGIASKFIYLHDDWYKSLTHSINKGSYFVFELKNGEPFLVCAQGKRSDAERFMHNDSVLVYNQIDVAENLNNPVFDSADEAIGEILTYGSWDYPYAIMKDNDEFTTFMFTNPSIILPVGKIVFVVYKGILFSASTLKL